MSFWSVFDIDSVLEIRFEARLLVTRVSIRIQFVSKHLHQSTLYFLPSCLLSPRFKRDW
jgi:hypothetical protein